MAGTVTFVRHRGGLGFIKVPGQYVVPTLRELTGEGFPEVLPALRHIFVDWPDPVGPALEAIAQSATVRLLSGYPVAIKPKNTLQ